MRAWAAALIGTGMLAGCATPPQPGSDEAAVQAPAPRTPQEALRPFYAALDLPLAARGAGAASLSPTAEITTIAFGSCMQHDEPAAAMRAVAQSDADLFVMLGDNVYGSSNAGDATLPDLRASYAALAENPDFQAVNGAMPILPLWDDHDFGINDGGGEFVAKEYAETLFHSFWRTPGDDPRLSRPGVYGSRTFGSEGRRVQVILLDTRFFRDPLKPTDEWGALGKERYMPHDEAGPTILGDQQWAWLEETLKEPADVKIVVSSIQIIADGHGFEGWKMFPAERERFYDLIRESLPPGVIFVSGDRHAAGLYEIDGVAGYPIVELTASSLNKPFLAGRDRDEDEPGPNRLDDRVFVSNYGTIAIDWDGGAVTVAIRDENGAVLQEITRGLVDMAAG